MWGKIAKFVIAWAPSLVEAILRKKAEKKAAEEAAREASRPKS